MESQLSQLTDDQSRILLCLKDIKDSMSQEEIKAIDPFLKKYKLNGNVGTTIFEMGILTKKRPYKWNIGDPDEILAKDVEEQSAMY